MFMTTTQTSDQTKPAEVMGFIPGKDAPFIHSRAAIAFRGGTALTKQTGGAKLRCGFPTGKKKERKRQTEQQWHWRVSLNGAIQESRSENQRERSCPQNTDAVSNVSEEQRVLSALCPRGLNQGGVGFLEGAVETVMPW